MPVALFAALLGSLAIHAAALFGTDAELFGGQPEATVPLRAAGSRSLAPHDGHGRITRAASAAADCAAAVPIAAARSPWPCQSVTTADGSSGSTLTAIVAPG